MILLLVIIIGYNFNLINDSKVIIWYWSEKRIIIKPGEMYSENEEEMVNNNHPYILLIIYIESDSHYYCFIT